MSKLAHFYADRQGIGWTWQSIDSKMSPAPLADDVVGRNPTDRGKQGSKVHLLVDERGAPLALHVTGANEHDKWSADDLMLAIVVVRPDLDECEQHLCADKGYDYEDVHVAAQQACYVPHIKHRRLRRVLAQADFPNLVQFDPELRKKNALTAHLPKGIDAHRRTKRAA